MSAVVYEVSFDRYSAVPLDEDALDALGRALLDELHQYVARKVGDRALRHMLYDDWRDGEMDRTSDGGRVELRFRLPQTHWFSVHWLDVAYRSSVRALARVGRPRGLHLRVPRRDPDAPNATNRGVGYVQDGGRLYEALEHSSEGNVIWMAESIRSDRFLVDELPAALRDRLLAAWAAPECSCPLCAAIVSERERSRARREATRTEHALDPEHEELLEDIAEDPSDDASRTRYLEWLRARGDPRAELIRQTQSDDGAPRAAVSALVKKHGKAWLGPVATVAKLRGVTFRAGFLDHVEVEATLGKQRAVGGAREWATVRSLVGKRFRSRELPYELVGDPVMRSLVRAEPITWETLAQLADDGRDRPLAEVVLEDVRADNVPEPLREPIRRGEGLPRLRQLELWAEQPAQLAWLDGSALASRLGRIVVGGGWKHLRAWVDAVADGASPEIELERAASVAMRISPRDERGTVALRIETRIADPKLLERVVPGFIEELAALPPGLVAAVEVRARQAPVRAQIARAFAAQPEIEIHEADPDL